ncbi:NAD-dependent epimerase/dehydratase family protein [Microbacterium sp. Bi121]|uniref:NAD-dependent epimerase/dehydratase family protein n=1 Tax=Microbacterium sp. Bi121 TaxID=2822348 RepID=UPI001DEFFE66|nr:NAD-dependent epimerase/dehydratase family protein [Microbacterium sp. Bi121]CAH0220699.1 N-acetyl-alpha-D-glucosaminyl-diphospho-ditrans, octacis-undecaprenol 4-epimerase [Microbacterium sp. Bi121]
MTGATGFVGRHFIAEATRRGHEVVALVRKIDPTVTDMRQIEVGDIADRNDWSEAVEGADSVVHLAARVHVMHEQSGDLDSVYGRVNVEPTIGLARAAADAGVQRFVFMSSIKVNGERTTGEPFSNASKPSPVDPYGRSKLLAEEGLAEVATRSRMSVAILRPTVVYGPGVGGNIRRIGGAVRRGIPLPIGSILNARTMVSVDNLVTGTLASLEAEFDGSRVFLLGDPTPLSTRQLAEYLAEGLGTSARLWPVPVGVLTFGARLLGRGADVARLVEDLVVRPDWGALGLSSERLRSTRSTIIELGHSLSQRGEV